MLGRSENRFSDVGKRLWKVLGIGIGQAKIFRDPVAGLMHALIFWGFLVLITAVTEAFVQGFYSGFLSVCWVLFLGFVCIPGPVRITCYTFGSLCIVQKICSSSKTLAGGWQHKC